MTNLRLLLREKVSDHWTKIGANVFWLVLAKAIRMPLALIVTATVARYLQPESFGFLSYIVSLAGIFCVFSTLGLKDIAIKYLAKSEECGKGEILGTVRGLQLAASVGNALIWTLISLYLYSEKSDLLIVSLIGGGVSLLKMYDYIIYFFESEVRAKILVRIDLIIFSCSSVVKLLLVYNKASLVWFGLALGFDWISTLLLHRFYFNKFSRGLNLTFNRAYAKRILKAGGLLILSGLSVSLAMRVDQVMIQTMLGDVFVGYYSASVRIAEPLLMFGGMLVASAYPMLVTSSETEFEHRFKLIFRVGFYLTLLAAISVSLFSGIIINLIYGDSYHLAAGSLSLLVFSIPITFISMMGSRFLLRYNAYQGMLSRQLIGLTVNILLNIYLIPKYGFLGAAIATVLTDITIALIVDIFTSYGRRLLLLKVKSILFIR